MLEDKNRDGMALAMLGRHLLATHLRARRLANNALKAEDEQLLQATIEKVMAAFAQEDGRGGVCVALSEKADEEGHLLKLEPYEIEALMAFDLMAKAPEKLSQSPSPTHAFILDEAGGSKRLYLQRNFIAERELALSILRFLAGDPARITDTQAALMDRFEDMVYDNGKKADPQSLADQRAAITGALTHRFFIITGGPGTGKTTVVAKLIECLLAQEELTVGLAAPTGKASSRVMQSIKDSVSRAQALFPKLDHLLANNSITSQTIHKWLFTDTQKGGKPSADNPLDPDVLIIDEASMIDLALAKRLFEAIDARRTRVILLGDKHQLAAVGPGSVLADLTAPEGAIAECVATLTVSHRFSRDSNIGELARFVNEAKTFDEETFNDLFDRQAKDSIAWSAPLGHVPLQSATKKWIKKALQGYIDAVKDYLNAISQNLLVGFEADRQLSLSLAIWSQAETFRILAAQRHGYNSVEAVNLYAESIIREAMNKWALEAIETGQISPNDYQLPFNERFYPGRLIINRVNSDALGIFNGDVGVALPLPEDLSRYEIFFGDQKLRRPAGLLPEHDTAFAMTIHQSQGSQFDRVAVLLPLHDSSLATKELLYTAITRAKHEVTLYSSLEAIRHATLTQTERASGLVERLRGH